MAAPSRVKSSIEDVDQQIREAIDAGDLTRYRVLLAEKAELLPGIGLIKFIDIVSIVLRRGLLGLCVHLGSFSADRESV
jgi:hypothetical protein